MTNKESPWKNRKCRVCGKPSHGRLCRECFCKDNRRVSNVRRARAKKLGLK